MYFPSTRRFPDSRGLAIAVSFALLALPSTACKNATCSGEGSYQCTSPPSSVQIELVALGVRSWLRASDVQTTMNELPALAEYTQRTCVRPSEEIMAALVARYAPVERVTLVMQWDEDTPCGVAREVRIDADRPARTDSYGIHVHSFPTVSARPTQN